MRNNPPHVLGRVVADFADVFRKSHTWSRMAFQDVFMRYRRSAIGPFWISISQSITVLAAAFLYSQIFKLPFSNFLHYVIAGSLAWNTLSVLMSESANFVIEAEDLIKSLPIRIPILAARLVFRNFIILLHNIIFFLVILVMAGAHFTWMTLWALLAIPVYLLFGFFFAIAIGPICALYRDLPLIIQNALQFMFFLTPILWKADQLPDRALFVHANPFYHAIELARAPLFAGRLPTAENWTVFGLCLAMALIAAIASLATTRGRVYFWV